MAITRITLADLVFGEPLRWDLFSAPAAPSPVLQKGQLLAPGPQLDGWLADGLYADQPPPSVLHSLNQLNARLEQTLVDLRDQASADIALRAIAGELTATVRRDPDIALAALFLNQIAGPYGVRHCTETAIVVSLVAQAMGKSAPECLIVTAAALTMNVGMVRQADLFQTRDGALTSEERALVRRHPNVGVDLLRWAGVTDEEWLSYVLLHHENDDGSGYPEGRLGHEIAQNAKLIGLADRYCAFVSARNYRRSLLPPEALARLGAEHAMPLDPSVLDHFAQQIGAFPPGTLVRVQNGATGVVVSRPETDGSLRLCLLRGADGNTLAQPEHCLTSTDQFAIAEALHEDQARLRFTMKQVWGDMASL